MCFFGGKEKSLFSVLIWYILAGEKKLLNVWHTDFAVRIQYFTIRWFSVYFGRRSHKKKLGCLSFVVQAYYYLFTLNPLSNIILIILQLQSFIIVSCCRVVVLVHNLTVTWLYIFRSFIFSCCHVVVLVCKLTVTWFHYQTINIIFLFFSSC